MELPAIQVPNNKSTTLIAKSHIHDNHRLEIVYLGPARIEKGFHLIPDIVQCTIEFLRREGEYAEFDDKKAATKAKLQDQSVALANTGLKVSLDMTTFKKPIREILDRIDSMNIDLVSMATHGEDGEKRALDESVTAEIIRYSKCPLLVWSAEPQCPVLT